MFKHIKVLAASALIAVAALMPVAPSASAASNYCSFDTPYAGRYQHVTQAESYFGCYTSKGMTYFYNKISIQQWNAAENVWVTIASHTVTGSTSWLVHNAVYTSSCSSNSTIRGYDYGYASFSGTYYYASKYGPSYHISTC